MSLHGFSVQSPCLQLLSLVNVCILTVVCWIISSTTVWSMGLCSNAHREIAFRNQWPGSEIICTQCVERMVCITPRYISGHASIHQIDQCVIKVHDSSTCMIHALYRLNFMSIIFSVQKQNPVTGMNVHMHVLVINHSYIWMKTTVLSLSTLSTQIPMLVTLLELCQERW